MSKLEGTHTLSQEEIFAMGDELVQASQEGNVKLVKSLIDRVGIVFVIDERGRAVLSLALLHAEKGGHTGVVEILKPYLPQSAGGRLLLFSYIPFFGINFICGLYVFLMKKKLPFGSKIYKYNRFSRIVALIGVVLWAIVIIISLL